MEVLQARMAADGTAGQAPFKVNFTNSSENADHFRWDFGDGVATTTRALEEVVTHEYTKAGTHTVTLTAIMEGEPDEINTATLTVAIEPGPLHRIDIEPPTLGVAKEQRLTATALDEFDNPIPGLTFTFRADERVGEIDNQGIFIAGTRPGIYAGAVTVGANQETVTKTGTTDVTIETGPLDHISVDPAATTLGVTGVQNFTASALDEFDNPIPGLAFAFQVDERVGEIDNRGSFIAGTRPGIYAGAVTVEVNQETVTRTATANITIETGPLDHISVDPAATTLGVTGAQQFTAMARDQFGNPIPGVTLNFSSVEHAGQVDINGLFTAGSRAGSYERGVEVEATLAGVTQTATISVIVQPGPLDHVIIDPALVTIQVTEDQQFTATALDRFNNPIFGLTLIFSSDEQAGKVTATGVFTAGTEARSYQNSVEVAVSQGSVKSDAAATVIVEPGPLDHVNLEPNAATVEVTEEQRFTVTALDRFDNPISGLTRTFGSDEDAGRVTAGGLFTAGTAAGTYKEAVTVAVTQGTTARGATSSVLVQHGLFDRVLLKPASVTLDIGQNQLFSVESIDAFDNPIPEARITWKVVGDVGEISTGGLLSTGTVAGTFMGGVTATGILGSVSAGASATVTVNPGPFDDLSIRTVEVAAGTTRQLEPLIADHHGNPASGVTVNWTVLDGNVGSIDSSGLLMAGEVAGPFPGATEAQGSHKTVIRTATGDVVIVPGPLDQVVIAPGSVEIGMEMAQQYVAVGADRFGNRISGLVFTWSVRTGGTINAIGLFTAETDPGTYVDSIKATATHEGITRSATANVTVLPDRIAFVSDRNDDQSDVYVMDLDGTNVERLTTNVGSSPTWSPGGRRIAYLGSDGIFVINDDGEWPVRVVADDFESEPVRVHFEPAWSPDGGKLAFVLRSIPTIPFGILDFQHANRDIFVADVDGGKITRLTNTTDGDESVPSWSPGSAKIVYKFTPKGSEGDIWVMNSDGTDQKRLTSVPEDDTDPSFSPDGRKILFLSAGDGDNEIYVMNINGTEVRQLTFNTADERSPSWSPDGTKILFVSTIHTGDGPSGKEIYIADIDFTDENNPRLSNVIRLTVNSDIDSSPHWAPRKRGVQVTQASIIIPGASALQERKVQEVTASARAAVVRIVTDLGSGSAFIFDSGGFLLTANHVISDATAIDVFLDNGIQFTATVQGRDLIRDLAVLKIGASNLPTLDIGDLSQLSLGQQVVVLGYPLGSETITVTSGFVSAEQFDSGRNIRWVQTDSAVNPGNSGGPLLNLQGQVVGVVAAKFVGVAIEGVGFAISANTAKTYLERLKAGEVITG